MARPLRRWLSLLLLGALAAASLGCAAVSPWERGTLARDEMAWEPDPVEALRKSHVYFSKEASTGGGSAGGGGCGCN